MMRRLLTLGIAVCMGVCAVSQGHAQDVPPPGPSYRALDLGTLGGASSTATGINDRGQVVGGSDTATGKVHAFIWEKGVMTDLGTLDSDSRADSSAAFAINNRTQVIGTSSVASPSGVSSHYFFWSNGTMTDLGELEGGTVSAINDNGQVVGYRGIEDATMAFIWEKGVMTDLGTLRGGYSKALGINNQGEVTGISDGSAFIWRKGVMQDVGKNSWPNAFISLGWAINEGGTVAGRVVTQGQPFQKSDPFLWHKDKVTVLSIGDEPNGPCSPSTVLYVSLNNSRQVVGSCSQHPTSISTGFLWSRGTTYFLPSISSPGPPATTPQESFARAINASGQIAGYSRFDSSTGVHTTHATLWVK